jgi:hypothetical protein
MANPILLPIWLCAAVMLAVQGGMPTHPTADHAEDTVTVQSRDGRILTGEVDTRTDENLLWLRCTAPSILVMSSVQWSQVVVAQYRGQALSAAEFRPLAEKLKSKLPADFFPSDFAWLGGASQSRPISRTSEPGIRQHPKVQSLHIEAAVANWDADVEIDGLELRVFPCAADGEIVPTHGMISVRLIGHYPYPTNRKDAFRELARWGKKVRTTDYGDWGAVYRFPFQNVHPEFDLASSADGLVHCKLGVPGQGNFEASVPISLRPYNPLREQLQLHQRKRFFPRERTGRGLR